MKHLAIACWLFAGTAVACSQEGSSPVSEDAAATPATTETTPLPPPRTGADAQSSSDGPAPAVDATASEPPSTSMPDGEAQEPSSSPTDAQVLPPPPQTGPGGPAPWNEHNGIISIEAEKGKGSYAIKEDPATSGGKYMVDQSNGTKCAGATYTMEFTFSTKTAGRWYLFLRARKGDATAQVDDENDVCMLIDGQRLYGIDNVTRPIGMRVFPTTWTWTFSPKGPGSHTPDAIRFDNTHAMIEKPGVHVLRFLHRSNNISIDKILMRHETVPDAKALPPPEDLGPPETL